MANEIEKKFLISKEALNYADINNIVKIEQFYLSKNPEIRVRKKSERKEQINFDGCCANYWSNSYTITIKIGDGLVRKEYEMKIDKKDFDDLLDERIGNIIKKERLFLNYIGNPTPKEMIIDLYEDLIIMEIEYKNIEHIDFINFRLKKFIIQDVTEDSRFKNKSIAINGFPKPYVNFL